MKLKRKQAGVFSIIALVACFAIAWFVIRQTNGRVQIEFDIHISKEAIYLSTYAEPPQFAIWLENPETGEHKQVFVTYRVSRGDWEGKSDVPVALPRWKAIFRDGGKRTDRSEEEIAVSGATPKADWFRCRAEVRPGSEWVCKIEMNLAGDYNEFYPQFNSRTKEEDEFACGQPALIYSTAIVAVAGNEYTPALEAISFWEEGGINRLAPVDQTITSAHKVFDEIVIRTITPKPVIIEKKVDEEIEIGK